MFKWIKSMWRGWEIADSLIALISAFGWKGVGMTLIGSSVFAYWAWSESLGHLPTALITLFVFTVLVWLRIGYVWLRTKDRPSKTKQQFDLSYGLVIQSLHLGHDEENKEASVQIGAVLFNATGYPIKYTVTDMAVIIGDRTLMRPKFSNDGGIIARGCTSIFYYPPFSEDVKKPRIDGVLKMTIKYGHPECEMVREARFELELSLRLDDKTDIVYLTKEHVDREI